MEAVGLPDGSEATLRYMEPADKVGAYGPYWEGEFDKRRLTYTVTFPLECGLKG